jgi:gentisate 1,2-dioxygenase
MAGNTQIDLHVTEIPPMTYAKAHRHTSDAFVLILGGTGYSLIWRGDDFKNRQRIDWQKGTLFSPPTYWYHQHLNTGKSSSRHLAINAPTLVQNLGLRFGDQIEAEPREIRDEWKRELEHQHAEPQ